jgi:beta-1,4-N-acetylglucosaminyltransferase
MAPAWLILLALLARAALGVRLAARRRRRRAVSTLVVLGSGGHTAEMLALLGAMDLRAYAPRLYVVADTDRLSGAKAAAFERAAAARGGGAFAVAAIPRSREVGQSFARSVPSSLRGAAAAARLVLAARPDLVLANGPGTALPVVAAAALARLVGAADARVAYVESAARAERLSLTGALVYRLRLADRFLVQWEALAARLPRARFAGRLF